MATARITLILRDGGNVSTSPGPTLCAGLDTFPLLTRTWPPDTSLADMPRVLKKRACHSHLSSRILSALGSKSANRPLNPCSSAPSRPLQRDCPDQSGLSCDQAAR